MVGGMMFYTDQAVSLLRLLPDNQGDSYLVNG
jgi:hypothetical protein